MEFYTELLLYGNQGNGTVEYDMQMRAHLANIGVGGGVQEGDSGRGAADLHVEQQFLVESVHGEGAHGLEPVVGVARELDASQSVFHHVRRFALRARWQLS